MSNRIVSVSREIDAPIERVWQAWTDPEDLKHWFTAEDNIDSQIFQFDVKVGGQVRLKFPGAAGEYTWTYVQIDKPRKLVIDILDFSFAEYPEGNGGICNIQLEDLGGKTKVAVSGELPDSMDNEPMLKMAQKGWSATLGKLNNYIREE